VLVRRSAVEATKHELRARGLKPQLILHRHIVAAAEAMLRGDAGWRAELIAEARPIVDRWTAEGFFGKRAALTAQNLEVMHNQRRPEPQALPLCETHERNGATR
jgi:hypothetical protein